MTRQSPTSLYYYDHAVTDMIKGYWGYHTERIENAYEDIDSLLATGKHVGE